MCPEVLIWGECKRYVNYARAVSAAGGRPRFFSSTAGADSCAGLLLPGGGDLEPWRYGQRNTASCGLEPERDAEELALLDRFTATGRPVLGICRGLQTINVFFGGTLLQDLPGHRAVDGADRYHAVRTGPSALRELYGESCIVNSAHHQAADRLGSGLQAVQWAPDGTVEALEHRTLPVWAVQWHPERMTAVTDGGRLFQAFLARCRS